jgi:hypothetical protein
VQAKPVPSLEPVLSIWKRRASHDRDWKIIGDLASFDGILVRIEVKLILGIHLGEIDFVYGDAELFQLRVQPTFIQAYAF